MHILIVDDDPAIREMLADLLHEEGYTAAMAEHGQAALDYLHSAAERPNVILLDLMMPVMTGWQFREAQQQTPALADIPVIILSARPQLRDEHERLAAAATFAKPIDLSTLLTAIEQWA